MIIIGLTVLFINTSLKRVNNLFVLLRFTLAVSNDIVYAKRILPVFTIRLSSLDISQRNVSWGQFRVAPSLMEEYRWFVVLCEALKLRAQSSLAGDANLPWQSSVLPEFIRWGSFFSDLRRGVVSDTSYSILSYSSSLSLSMETAKLEAQSGAAAT